MTHSPLPGSRWFQWIRNRTLRVGILTGVYLTAIMMVAILAANRLAFLEPFADFRNWTARVVFALAMLIPVACHLRTHVRYFIYSVAGWLVFLAVLAGLGVSLELQAENFRGLLGAVAVVFFIHLGALVDSPVRLFASAMCGWAMLTIAYAVMGLFFEHLFIRLHVAPFHLLILGALLYGLAAVASWVCGMALALRHQPIAAHRRRP